ncbi:MarR family transcriptional regulator [Eubacteriaceae bacterium ES2]|nr:MarR family transcriptional regulator [Eubacteriaceae bacterium ES2]
MEQDLCGPLFKQINDKLERNVNNALRSQGLTMAQVRVLVFLEHSINHSLTLKEIEQIMHVAQSTAAGIVSRLEQKKMVESFGSLEDKRIKMVHITPSGLNICRDAEKDMIKTEEKLLSGLTESEQKIFRGLLVKVWETIK